MSIRRLCDSKEPAVCGVCARRATYIGYRHNDRAKLMWLCGNIACTEIAQKVYNMGEIKRDEFEIGAVREGVAAMFDMLADKYPDIVPVLQTISEQDITEFGLRFLKEYATTMVNRITSHSAPF